MNESVSGDDNAQIKAQFEALRARIDVAQAEAAKAEALRTSAEARAARAEALNAGTFFAAIDVVWKSSKKGYIDNHESFVRSHDVPDDKNRYAETVVAAKMENTKVNENDETASEFSQSQPSFNSGRSRDSSVRVDIFGTQGPDAHSAHLLPHSSRCASHWFHIVPWVLYTNKEELSWDFLQKCIHGSTNVADAGHENGSKKSGATKLPKFGIKHFPTNRIHMTAQATYFDTYPCVIIVPIMSVDNVRDWKGERYDAIVLAGDWKDEKKKPLVDVKASVVYTSIKAAMNFGVERGVEEDLANKFQCATACTLLEKMILGVCQAFRDSNLLRENLYPKGNNIFEELESQLIDNTAPVPEMKFWTNEIKVRKITFKQRSEDNQKDAPDPLLLLAKAASNWLKRHKMEILPACGDGDSCSTDSVISFTASKEVSKQGLTYIIPAKRKLGIEEVIINLKMDEVEEPLSDDESFSMSSHMNQ